jgi:predicted ester cyclase
MGTRAMMERGIGDWNNHDQAAWSAQFIEQAVLSGPGGLTGSGPAAVAMFYSLWQDAFPDNRIRPVEIVVEGDHAVLEAVFEGTHTAPLKAPIGTIPPTGKRVSIPYVLLSDSSDGKWTTFRLYFDQMALLMQLGLAPAAAAADAG